MRRFLLFLMFLPSGLFAGAAVINVNTASTVNTLKPFYFFGNNFADWVSKSDQLATAPQWQAAASFFQRYPGGSASDDYHWNSQGSLDAKGWWVPDNTTFKPGFSGGLKYRGTNSSYGIASNLTDGDSATLWRSHPDTDLPNAQWAYIDLGALTAVNSVQIEWGDPYATLFTVQRWNPANPNQWTPYQSNTDGWINTSAADVVGTGGQQTVNFSAVSTRWVRVLLKASSQGAGGVYSMAELRVYNGASLVSVPSKDWKVQDKTSASSTDPSPTYASQPTFDFESFMDSLKAYSPRGEAYITVNFGTGTPQEAAAWVHYANVVRGYGIKYWEVGNEVHGDWETGGPLCARDYARRYMKFYEAMKAEDPSIMVIGPCAGNPTVESNDYDNKTFIQGFVDRMAGVGKAAYAEGIAFHWYPYWNNDNEASSLAAIDQVAPLAATQLPAMLVNHPQAATVPLFITEFNSGDATNLAVRLMDGLWLANFYGELAKAFGSRAYTHVFSSLCPGDADIDPTKGDFGLLQLDNNAWRYQPRASYWALQLLATRWSLAGSFADHSLLSTSSNQPLLPAYALRRPDGKLSLAVINKSPALTFTATVNLNSFSPGATARTWTLDASTYAWDSSSVPYHAAPDLPPTQSTQAVSGSFARAFGPYSLTVFEIDDASLPYASPTPTATPAPSLSPTPAPTYPPLSLIDDFEDAFRDGAFNRAHLWGGHWEPNHDLSTTTTTSFNGPPALGARSMHMQGLIAPGGWCNWPGYLHPEWPLQADDLAAKGFVGLQFWVYGDGKTYRMSVATQAVSDFDYYGNTFTPPAGVWTLIRLPFAAMRRSGWGAQMGLPLEASFIDATGVQFTPQSPGSFDVRIDDVALYQAVYLLPSPTPTPAGGPLRSGVLNIHESLSVPHPAHGPRYSFMFNLESAAEFMELWVYGGNLQRLATQRFNGPYAAGWNRVTLEQAGIPKGVNYYVLQAGRGEARARSDGRLVVIP